MLALALCAAGLAAPRTPAFADGAPLPEARTVLAELRAWPLLEGAWRYRARVTSFLFDAGAGAEPGTDLVLDELYLLFGALTRVVPAPDEDAARSLVGLAEESAERGGRWSRRDAEYSIRCEDGRAVQIEDLAGGGERIDARVLDECLRFEEREDGLQVFEARCPVLHSVDHVLPGLRPVPGAWSTLERWEAATSSRPDGRVAFEHRGDALHVRFAARRAGRWELLDVLKVLPGRVGVGAIYLEPPRPDRDGFTLVRATLNHGATALISRIEVSELRRAEPGDFAVLPPARAEAASMLPVSEQRRLLALFDGFFREARHHGASAASSPRDMEDAGSKGSFGVPRGALIAAGTVLLLGSVGAHLRSGRRRA